VTKGQSQVRPEAAEVVSETAPDTAALPPVFEDLLDATAPALRRIDGVVIGTLTGFDPSGGPAVEFQGMASDHPLPARSVAPLGSDTVGRPVALLFEGGDPRRPLVLGLLHQPAAAPAREPEPEPEPERHRLREAEIDGRKVIFSATDEIVLRCGEASITLTAAGKVLIQGAYLSSRSTGVNRIKGGSVQIN
jgi:hypothetical protein